MKRFMKGCIATILVVVLQASAFADDEQIAKEIVTRLQKQQTQSNLNDFNIGVQVDNGTVTMMGQVANSNSAMTALDIARRVPGVRLVINDLYVQNETPTQAYPANQIQQASAQVPQAAVRPTQPVAATVAVPTAPAVGAGVPQMAMQQQPAPQPLAFAKARPMTANVQPISRTDYSYSNINTAAGPAPVPMGHNGSGAMPAGYDSPQVPNYAWPSYAASPNYAALTYPQQYSPTAWPYIGPFYPYPQVPLGWRKVTLEWDDGWWFLDFKSK
ncbi:MAG: BON domain-containing protein [Pirellulaceae bacterium]